MESLLILVLITCNNMSKHVRDYTTVNIPTHLAEKVGEIMKREGYLNLGDFVREAVRRRLDELEKETK